MGMPVLATLDRQVKNLNLVVTNICLRVELGYGLELAAMSSIDILAKHSLVNQTRPCTDRGMLFPHAPNISFDMIS